MLLLLLITEDDAPSVTPTWTYGGDDVPTATYGGD
jgi:hypothetical protein